MTFVMSLTRQMPIGLRTAAIAALLILLFILPAPVFPTGTLDGEWMLAVEQAARTGAIFGRDFVFTYGPFGVLATSLFTPESFAGVLLAGAAIGLCWLGPLLTARRPYLIVLYALAALVPVAVFAFDIRSVSALLAGGLLAMVRPGRWSLTAAAGCGALALSKLSFGLAALPLLLLVDFNGVLVWRRLPLHVPTFLIVFLIGLSASGTPPVLWITAGGNVMSIIAAYSGAMQLVMRLGGAIAMLAMLAMLAVTIGCFGWLIHSQRRILRRPVLETLFPLLAIIWCLWMSFKMGFGRADEHMILTWSTLAMTIPAVFGVLEVRHPLTPRQRMVAPVLLLLAMAGSIGVATKIFAQPPVTPAMVMHAYAEDLAHRPIVALSWLTPAGWRAATANRQAAEDHIRRRFAITDGTTADVIPQRLGPVILSNLAYHPRPVPQSYSAFTERLQRLDARHFASANAPRILFMDVFSEIDERLPTLSAGPSLPIIARWYDPIGTDPLGAVLRRRVVPRPVRRSSLPPRTVAFGQWVALPPAASGTIITAAMTIPRTILGRLIGLLAREPIVFIELRRIDGKVDRYRLVPGMTEAGVVLSPMVRDPSATMSIPDRTIGLIAPGSRPGATIQVNAVRLIGDLVASHAYADGTIRFQTWNFDAGATSATR